MNSLIFTHHPAPKVADADKYQALHFRAGKHHRQVYVRAELFDGDVTTATKHAEKTKGAGEVVLKVLPYEQD